MAARRRRLSPKLASLFVVPLVLLVNVVLFEPWKAGIYTMVEVVRAWPELGHRRALRNEIESVIEAQDRYFRLHKQSTTNAADLGISADGIRITIVASWGGGWSAMGSHEKLPPMMQCGVFDVIDSSLRLRLPGRIELRRPREVMCSWDYAVRRQTGR